MDMPHAVAALQALAHHGRLSIYCLLAKAGPCGLGMAQIASELRVGTKTLIPHLVCLSREGLVRSHRNGRFTIYVAEPDRLTALLAFLASCNSRIAEGAQAAE